ncbi:MAG: PCRF domain-containing protein, partial [Dehalococcoidia bacterium]|nr:PCRF domain-containing protein [Dehalococcoidia bacterium]
MDDAIREQLKRLVARFDDLTRQMGEPEIAADFERSTVLTRERAELSTIVELFESYLTAETRLSDAEGLFSEDDPEM